MKMRKLYSILLPLLILFLFSSISYNQTKDKNSSKKSIKALTFNIRYGTARDGENSWEFRKNLLFEILKEENADVIGLQEALRTQLDEIRMRFPEYEELGVGREDGVTAGEYSAILYKTSRFKADTTGYFWFSDTPDVPASKSWGNNVTRICTWALLNDKTTKRKFYFYNLHTDHESQNSREKSAELLLKYINKGKYPVLVSGDFNAGEDNKAILILKDAGLRDSFREINPKETVVGTFNEFKGTTNGDKIDYLFCSKEFRVFSAEIIRKNNNGKYPSDHFPVNAVIGF